MRWSAVVAAMLAGRAAMAFHPLSRPLSGAAAVGAAWQRARPLASTPDWNDKDAAVQAALGSIEDEEQGFEDAAGGGGWMSSGKADPDKRANDELIEWLKGEGVYLRFESDWGQAPHAFALSTETRDENEDEPSGRGLLLRYEVKEYDKLLEIPYKVCMTKEAAHRVLGTRALPRSFSEYICIALLLIHERFVVGKDSYWAPYINVLPETSDVSPSFTWSDEELALLEGSPCIVSTRSMQAKLRREYQELVDGLFAKHPGTYDTSTVFTFANFEWAFTMLFSRAIRLDKLSDGPAVALVPYADLINHSPFSTAYVTAEKPMKIFFQKEDKVVIYSDRTFRRAEQFLISYGQKSNAELLLLYGFSLDRNPFNSVEISVGLLPSDELYDDKLRFLQDAGRGDINGTGLTFPLYNDRYTNEMLECIRLLCVTPDELVAPDGTSIALSELDTRRVISQANEQAVFETLIQACNSGIDRYPTTEDEDTAMMLDRSMFKLLPQNSRNAIRLRRTEKRLLKRTIATAERRLIEIRTGIVQAQPKPWERQASGKFNIPVEIMDGQ